MEFACSSAACFGFHADKVYVKLPIGVISGINGYPAMDWRPVQGEHRLAPEVVWDWLQLKAQHVLEILLYPYTDCDIV